MFPGRYLDKKTHFFCSGLINGQGKSFTVSLFGSPRNIKTN